MRNPTILRTCLSVVVVAVFLAGCAGMTPSESNFTSPKVILSHIEIPYYTGYWYYAKKVEPTKGTPGDYGAPMMLAFVFNIENTASYPVQLDGFKFSVMFEDFEVNTVSSPETMWIPAGKTNQLRVPAMFDTRQTLLTLLLPGAMMLKEKGITPWDALEKWWTGAPDFSFPVKVSEGSAVFKADGLVKVVPFENVFP
jgi:hypothetical protein